MQTGVACACSALFVLALPARDGASGAGSAGPAWAPLTGLSRSVVDDGHAHRRRARPHHDSAKYTRPSRKHRRRSTSGKVIRTRLVPPPRDRSVISTEIRVTGLLNTAAAAFRPDVSLQRRRRRLWFPAPPLILRWRAPRREMWPVAAASPLPSDAPRTSQALSSQQPAYLLL